MATIKIYSISLGCPKTRVDTETLLGSLGSVQPVDMPDDADIIFINTCGFIAPAIEESVTTILECAPEVDEGERDGRRPLVAAAGCLVSRFGEELYPQLPEVDVWLPLSNQLQWPAIIRSALGLEPSAEVGRILSTGPGFAYLKVSEGCAHNCSFCTIPAIRGGLASKPVAELRLEAQSMIAQGAKELVIVAQDSTAYGRDLGLKHGLKELCDSLLDLDGLHWLRLMYLYPAGLDDDFLAYMKGAGEELLPYFDVPLQHAHPEILSSMGRPFARDPRKVIDRVRDHFPEAALRTSLIVGYPGETQTHFDHLLQFVREVRLHHLGVFAFEAEEGTKAALLPNQVSRDIALERKDLVMSVQAEISEDILESYAGESMDVLVGEQSPEWPGLHQGRVWFQAPEVDGVTYVSGPGVSPGQMVRAEIVDTKTYDLVALES